MGHDLQQTRYDQLIRRVGAIIGPGSKVAEALSELFPVIDVERVPGELLLLGGTHLCIGAARVAADVAESPRVQLFNPVESGKLITVSSVQVATQTAGQINYATSIIALTNGVGTEVFRDRRLSTVGGPVGEIRTDSTVALTDAHGQIRLGVNVTNTLEDPNSIAVLPPGSGFEVGGTVLNSALTVTFNWRERVAEQSELSF